MSEMLNSFLAMHCTQSDDHDFESCRKCAEMKEGIEALIAAARVDAANEQREKCAKACEDIAAANYTGGIDTPDDYARRCLEGAAKFIRATVPLPDRSEAFLREKINEAIEAGIGFEIERQQFSRGERLELTRPTLDSILAKASRS